MLVLYVFYEKLSVMRNYLGPLEAPQAQPNFQRALMASVQLSSNKHTLTETV